MIAWISSRARAREVQMDIQAAEKTTCKSSDEMKNLVMQIRDAVILHHSHPGDHCIDQGCPKREILWLSDLSCWPGRREDYMQER